MRYSFHRIETALTLRELVDELSKKLRVWEFVYEVEEGNLYVAQGTEVPFGYGRVYAIYSPAGDPIGVPDKIVEVGKGLRTVYVFESEVDEFLSQLKIWLDAVEYARLEQIALEERRRQIQAEIWVRIESELTRVHRHLAGRRRQYDDLRQSIAVVRSHVRRGKYSPELRQRAFELIDEASSIS